MNENATATLTSKEKETLRLILRGHDAKSSARALDLSVHTINGRLRDARRKLGVTSSKEAARRLLAEEGRDFLADEELGAASGEGDAQSSGSSNGAHSGHRRITGGILAMSAILALALAAAVAHDPTPLSAPQATASDTAPERVAVDHATEAAAREWLADVDAGDWKASYDATGSQFRARNTLEVWSDTSERVRTPLGAAASRVAAGYRQVYAPPNGYRSVEFRTDFSGKPDALETVTLEREEGEWRVVAYIIE
jgi:DNA-binding CsgD family transcriptional regulator